MAEWDKALWRVRKHPAMGTGRSASPWWVRGLHELVLLEAGVAAGGMFCLHALHAPQILTCPRMLTLSLEECEQEGPLVRPEMCFQLPHQP